MTNYSCYANVFTLHKLNTNTTMSLFHHTIHSISFQKSDPLGGGLREEIEREQNESEAITLDAPDGDQLADSWSKIVGDVKQDPDWFDFTEDDSAA